MGGVIGRPNLGVGSGEQAVLTLASVSSVKCAQEEPTGL